MVDGVRPNLDTRAVRLEDLGRRHVSRPTDKARNDVSGGPEVVAAKYWQRGRVEVCIPVVERQDDGLARQSPRAFQEGIKIGGGNRVIAAVSEPVHLRREIARGD